MTTFNNYFNTDFNTYNKNGLKAFKLMLNNKGFKEVRSDWFVCGSTSKIKYVFRNGKSYICFSYDNDNRIDISDYELK